MTATLIALLFVMQLIALYFISMLYLKYSNLKQIEGNQQKMLQEMEQAFTLYLQDMQEENDRLLAEMKNLAFKQKNSEKVVASQVVVEDIKPTFTPPKAQAVGAYKKTMPSPIKKEETVEEIVHRLAMEGNSIEQIARSLGKGKTEVELLLKFNRI